MATKSQPTYAAQLFEYVAVCETCEEAKGCADCRPCLRCDPAVILVGDLGFQQADQTEAFEVAGLIEAKAKDHVLATGHDVEVRKRYIRIAQNRR